MEHEGIFFGFFETGSEGTCYSLWEHKYIISEEKWDMRGIKHINPGDYIVINDKDGNEVFNGVIEGTWEIDEDKPLAYEPSKIFAGWLRYPGNPEYGQCCFNNYWVHWFPTNIDLNLWWDIFFENSMKYTGKIIKK